MNRPVWKTYRVTLTLTPRGSAEETRQTVFVRAMSARHANRKALRRYVPDTSGFTRIEASSGEGEDRRGYVAKGVTR